MSGTTRLVARAVAAWVLAAGASGCATRPANRPVLREISVSGVQQVDRSELLEHLATKATATTLGLTLQYEAYDRFVFERDIRRIERYYRARGFYDARVRAGRVVRLPKGEVRVELAIDEGQPTRVSLVRIERLTEPSKDAGFAVGKAQTLLPGDRFDEEAFARMKRQMLRALTDHGHAHAKLHGGFTEGALAPTGGEVQVISPSDAEAVDAEDLREMADLHEEFEAARREREAESQAKPYEARRYGVRLDATRHTAEIFLQIEPGPVCTYGPITIEGAGDLPKTQLERAIGLKKGDVFSTAELESARHALLEMGIFSSVDVTAQTGDGSSSEVPVSFKLAAAPLRTLTFGGGLQTDVLQSDVHFFTGYEHQNFLGGLRRLIMQARPGIVLFPSNLQNLLPPERPLPELRSRAELRQPQFLESRTRGTLRSEFLVYPYLLPTRNSAEVPDVVVGYREVRESAGLDRSFFNGKLLLSTSYNFQLSYPFSYVGPLDEGLQRVLLSHLSFGQAVDLRDNAIKPRLGAFFSNEIQLAGGLFGGDADDIKIQPDVRFYVPISRRITAATRASVGFLFPRSYGDTLGKATPDRLTDQLAAFNFEAARNRDLQLLFFRAFFSGGPNSNRGYALRGVGPRGIAPFRLGGTTALRNCVGRVTGGSGASGAAAQLARLPPLDANVCSVPLGGLSLWEWSGELRMQLAEQVSLLLFLDASDVTRERLALRLNFPHLTAGGGLRLDTPVGPVRLDLGYAVPGLQRLGGTLDPNEEGQPATFLGLPVAMNIAVGEAF